MNPSKRQDSNSCLALESTRMSFPKRKETRVLRDLRREYINVRAKHTDAEHRGIEEINMLDFQEQIVDITIRMYLCFKNDRLRLYKDVQSDEDKMVVESVFVCRAFISALYKYAARVEKEVSDKVGFKVGNVIPKQIATLTKRITEFIGAKTDKQLDENIRLFGCQLCERIANIRFFDKFEDEQEYAKQVKQANKSA